MTIIVTTAPAGPVATELQLPPLDRFEPAPQLVQRLDLYLPYPFPRHPTEEIGDLLKRLSAERRDVECAAALRVKRELDSMPARIPARAGRTRPARKALAAHGTGR